MTRQWALDPVCKAELTGSTPGIAGGVQREGGPALLPEMRMLPRNGGGLEAHVSTSGHQRTSNSKWPLRGMGFALV
jgi:hypothetical protein